MIPVMVVPFLTDPHGLLDDMIASIDYPVDHLIVIDNGDQTSFARCRNPHVGYFHPIVMPVRGNLGVAGSWNLGVKVTSHAPWWMIVNFDVTWPPGSLALFDRADSSESLVLSGGAPPWCAFSIGQDVVRRVGLFDEALHPAYFEDNDYERRCEAAGVPIVRSGIPARHRNSSTLAAGYGAHNARSFGANAEYYGMKAQRGDLTSGTWSLDRRRDQSWD